MVCSQKNLVDIFSLNYRMLQTVSVVSELSAAAPSKPRGAVVSFKTQMLRAREDAIVEAANRLLAEKGFDLMTMDQVAADVGIAKASLYKHFSSKEQLAAAGMVCVLGQALAFLATLPAAAAPLDQLKAVVRWMMQARLAGRMPNLPSENSTLRATLLASNEYLTALTLVSDQIGGWIEQAQANGTLSARLPPLLVLFTLYARACDPVPEFMKLSGQYSDEKIVEWVLAICFDGLNTR